MGKGSKGKKPRKHKKALQGGLQAQVGQRAGRTSKMPDNAVRPTPERAQHGTVSNPTGAGKGERPSVVLDHDQVARLYEAGALTYRQEQAARSYQQIHADYVAELGIPQGRSCLDIGPPGFDATEGNPAVLEHFRTITRALGMRQDAEVRRVVIDGRKFSDLILLRAALDVVAERC